MFYLGVDGGGTKTDFIIINKDARIIAFDRMESTYNFEKGIDYFEEVLTAGINHICEMAGITIGQVKHSFFGLPGYGEKREEITLLEDLVSRVISSSSFKIGNDVEAGWAGSLACQPGINIVGGTGAIGFGRDQLGNSARASGWGHFCGDEGSAYWLGKKVISLFGKEADGREEISPIYNIIRDKFKLERDLDFISVIYDKFELKRDKIASLALLLYEAAEKGDKKAERIYQEAAYEHSLTVKSLISKLNFDPEQKIKVSYSGGVFRAGHYILNPFREYLQADNVELIKPILQPITGAALYALILAGKPANTTEIIEKLKREEGKIELLK
jgi:N-acetylglucosamine kinase-like BadF-type ATPase